jgi:hypothetical protein
MVVSPEKGSESQLREWHGTCESGCSISKLTKQEKEDSA